MTLASRPVTLATGPITLAAWPMRIASTLVTQASRLRPLPRDVPLGWSRAAPVAVASIPWGFGRLPIAGLGLCFWIEPPVIELSQPISLASWPVPITDPGNHGTGR